MAEKVYNESNYRFTDPIRFFKQNDPYYFEVDNIPLKQLQENCLWLKDQINHATTTSLVNVKRSDIEELRPYALGADRLVRVKPGRYTARINDASTREPLAYLEKVMGDAIGDVDAWAAKRPGPPSVGYDPWNDKAAILEATLDKFKSALAQDALGMNGLVERAFTWPVVNSDIPVNYKGAKAGGPWLSYGYNSPGIGASWSPFVITEALTWARSQELLDFLSGQGYENLDDVALPSFEITNGLSGWAKFPMTESFFIKAWRGVSRLSIVDIDEELSIEVPQFDPDDFSYTDENGNTTSVAGVSNRIDLVFIYSKPIDASAVNTIQNGTVTKITKPTLGIVKGAGIKSNYSDPVDDAGAAITAMNKVPTGDSIHAAPGDQSNEQMGFTSTAENDISVSIRGSFPSPDDLMNLAPLISEKLEDSAYELIGQSILPVAYVFVQGDSQVVLSTDVVDIRPLFRTAELTYNERAGIGAAFPQLSLANPAVGKGQLDYELRRVYEDLNGKIISGGVPTPNPVAMGYIFGGWNFGVEGALFDFYQKKFAGDTSDTNDSIAYIKEYITSKFGIGSTEAPIAVPDYPDWDLANWCAIQELDNKGYYPNDYITSFVSQPGFFTDSEQDWSVVAGCYREPVLPDGTTPDGGTPKRIVNFASQQTGNTLPEMKFHFISKKIKFARPADMIDYEVDCKLINCVAQNNNGGSPENIDTATSFGQWIEKGYDYFIIYIAMDVKTNYLYKNNAFPPELAGNPGAREKGDHFAGFTVLTDDILYSNMNPASTSPSYGYEGNPRAGRCIYPTVMWKMTGYTTGDSGFLYGNLNGASPTIAIK